MRRRSPHSNDSWGWHCQCHPRWAPRTEGLRTSLCSPPTSSLLSPLLLLELWSDFDDDRPTEEAVGDARLGRSAGRVDGDGRRRSGGLIGHAKGEGRDRHSWRAPMKHRGRAKRGDRTEKGDGERSAREGSTVHLPRSRPVSASGGQWRSRGALEVERRVVWSADER